MNILSQKYPIFKDSESIVVGSLKENTKIGRIDETDVTLILGERLKKHLEFDKEQQKIMVRKYHFGKLGKNADKEALKIPDELKPFLQLDNSITTYTQSMYGSIDVKNLLPSLKNVMKY